ncbi:MAG: endonuclease III domain-containing protein [Chloroflexota bacterium]|nr:endonuclease III domain-containing protein [Chloroflexota bacterium]
MSLPQSHAGHGESLLEVYARLLAAYGPQGWWPGSGDPFEIVVGAVLTQSVAWANVERALTNLRAAGVLSAAGMHALPDAALAALVRPSGYYTVKARRLRAVVRMVMEEFGGDLRSLLALPLPLLRGRLLGTYGIGQETADDIVVYAAGQPSFIVDAYTVRLFTRLGLGPPAPAAGVRPTALSVVRTLPVAQEVAPPVSAPVLDDRRYALWQGYFTALLPADAALFNEYHALIVRHGVARCRKHHPRCADCPLLSLCPTGQALSAPNIDH